MNILSMALIVIGLCLFETVSSVDNAVINAEVLSTMGQRSRKWFLLWGMVIAVFVVRGTLPWMIVWLTSPSLGPLGALTATFSSDAKVLGAINASKPVLLVGGGIFLVFLFLHWLFLDDKIYGFFWEKFINSQNAWFYTCVSAVLSVVVWFAIKRDPVMAVGAVIGSTAFFITHGFKFSAEKKEQELKKGGVMSDVAKLFYLEMIDATFSIDGVLGAFAFTISVPLILIGNGLGALVVRQLTVGNIETIRKFKFLKNGAMYSVMVLGVIMIAEAFGLELPFWATPVITFVIIGYFFVRSVLNLYGAKKGRKKGPRDV